MKRNEEDEWRTTALYDAMVEMGYDAVGITVTDFQFGRGYLEDMRRKHKVPFVACNIVDKKTRKLFVDPYVVKTAGEFVVAIIGLASREDFQYPASTRAGRPATLNPALAKATEDLIFLDPRDALIAALKRLERRPPRPNVYALVSAIDARKLAELLKEFPQITVVFNDGQLSDIAPKRPTTPPPGAATAPGVTSPPQRTDSIQVNGAWVYHGGRSYTGKLVGEIKLDYQEGKIKAQDSRWTNLGEQYADDPAVRKLINQFYGEWSKKVALEGAAEPKNKWAELESNRNNAFIGAKACSECHKAQYDLWERTHHADADLRLASANKHFHPDCASCHNTGYGYPTGYKIADQTPTLTTVQCEACHGPGKLHRDAKGAKFIRAKPGKEYCVECHDEKQTPDLQENFDFYYQRVKHTEEAVILQRPMRDPRAPDAPGKRSQ